MLISPLAGRPYGRDMRRDGRSSVIRVMLCGLTPVLADATRTVLDDTADMSFVGDEALQQVEQAARSKQFDALLLGATTPAAADPSRYLLDRNPLLKIVCISPDGREAVLQERRLDRVEIDNVSFDRIFTALRDAFDAEQGG